MKRLVAFDSSIVSLLIKVRSLFRSHGAFTKLITNRHVFGIQWMKHGMTRTFAHDRGPFNVILFAIHKSSPLIFILALFCSEGQAAPQVKKIKGDQHFTMLTDNDPKSTPGDLLLEIALIKARCGDGNGRLTTKQQVK